MTLAVLIVDDQRLNRRLLSRILGNEEGVVLREASDGAEALASAFEDPPDLVLLDIVMPVHDGFEVCERLLADERTKSVPIIFLTALDDATKKVEGLQMGSADYITKPFNREEVLARVQTQLRLRGLTKRLAAQNRRLVEKQKLLDRDLEAAAALQGTLIPAEGLEVGGINLAWRFLPCDAIGGDIFNVVQFGDGVVGLYVVDVTGHGVPAAMVTVSVAQSLSPYAGCVSSSGVNGERLVASPTEVLQSLDEDYPPERFGKTFTMSYMVLDTKTGELSYSCAAHPASILLRKNGESVLLDEGGSLIGLGGFLPFEQGASTLSPGDRLVLYSDGIIEHSPDDDPEQMFGIERLLEALERQRSASLDQMCQSVIDSLDLHAGGSRPLDDISLLAIELTGVNV